MTLLVPRSNWVRFILNSSNLFTLYTLSNGKGHTHIAASRAFLWPSRINISKHFHIDPNGDALNKVFILIIYQDLDFYASIKFVNYIRSEVKKGNPQPDISSRELFEDEKYLQPVLEDDALLFSLDDLLSATDHADDSTPHNADDLTKIANLEETLERLQNTQSQYSDFVKRTLEDTWDKRAAGSSEVKKSDMTEHEKRDDSYFKSYSFNGKLD